MTEILIGLTAASSPAALGLLQHAYVSLYPSLPHSLGALTAVRLAIAFAALIVPTALMGATLPLVLKASAFRQSAARPADRRALRQQRAGRDRRDDRGRTLSDPGPRHSRDVPDRGGVEHPRRRRGARLVGRRPATRARDRLDAARTRPADSPIRSPDSRPRARDRSEQAQLGIVLGVFALSGVVSLALEVVWFRVLTLFLRPTVYGFAVMLATILAGISIGSYLITPWLGRLRMRWMALLAGLELAIGIAAVCSFGPLTYLPAVSRQLTPVLSRVMPEYLAYPDQRAACWRSFRPRC